MPTPNEELKEGFEALQKAVNEMRAKNDAHILEQKKGMDDVVRKDELKRIDDAIDAAETKMKAAQTAMEQEILALKRQPTNGNDTRSPDAIAYSKKFDEWFRKGTDTGVSAHELRQLEQKALSVGSDPDGGFTVLPEIDQTITSTVKLVSPFRQYASVRAIGTSALRRMVNVHGTTSRWVGEAEARTETTSPKLVEIETPVHEIMAQPQATQSLLDDSFLNIESWLADEVALEFAQAEGIAFINGDGVKRPRGILTETIVADSTSLTFPQVGYKATGANGAFITKATGNQPADVLLDVVYALKAAYRANGVWLMNRRTAAVVRKLKDAYDNYIWQPGAQAGQPGTLFAYPVADMEDMPDIANNSYSIAFGDWKRAYTIVDRIGTRVLRDPFTNTPFVIFKTTKRVGGKVQMPEAYKVLKFSAS